MKQRHQRDICTTITSRLILLVRPDHPEDRDVVRSDTVRWQSVLLFRYFQVRPISHMQSVRCLRPLSPTVLPHRQVSVHLLCRWWLQVFRLSLQLQVSPQVLWQAIQTMTIWYLQIFRDWKTSSVIWTSRLQVHIRVSQQFRWILKFTDWQDRLLKKQLRLQRKQEHIS